MIQLKNGAGLVVAGDVQNAVSAVDDALLTGARMCASVIEATQGANIPVQQTQHLLRAISHCLSLVVDSREQLVAAVKQMNLIKSQSNLAPISYGCPDGWPATASAAPAKRPAQQLT